MDLTGQRGFVVQGQWFPNHGRIHEENAFSIIEANGWKQEWLNTHGSCQDFLVFEKNGIQLGSGTDPYKLLIKSCMREKDWRILDFKRKFKLNWAKYKVIYF